MWLLFTYLSPLGSHLRPAPCCPPNQRILTLSASQAASSPTSSLHLGIKLYESGLS